MTSISNLPILHPKHAAVLALSCAIGCAAVSPASAASVAASGPSALALTAVIAPYSSLLSYDKRAISRLFRGDSSIGFPATRKISIAADSLVCRISNADITVRSCDIVFKNHKRTLKAREASELVGALSFAGVAAEGSAGATIKAITNLECAVDPSKVKQKDGSGANCTFEMGQ
jgi:hypothetical protein